MKDEAYYRALMRQRGVPEHLHDPLVWYLTEGLMPGSFLTAVLENKLIEAYARADTESRAGMYALVSFVYNDVPAAAWGSADKVEGWSGLLHGEGKP